MFKKNIIKSTVADIIPDNWSTFYLFYFNQGLGSDASFQIGKRLVHIFVGNLMTTKNNDTIGKVVDKKFELAAGEFIHILTQINDHDLEQFRSSVGAALQIESESGKAKSILFKNKKELKTFVINLRSQGAKQLH